VSKECYQIGFIKTSASLVTVAGLFSLKTYLATLYNKIAVLANCLVTTSM